MSQLNIFIKFVSVFSNVKHKLQICSHIQYLYEHTGTARRVFDLSLRQLSDYYTVGSDNIFLEHQVSAKSMAMFSWDLEILQRFYIITVRL